MLILDGRKTREALLPALIEKIRGLTRPTLAIIQVGNRADSTAFINAKKAFAVKIGVDVKHIQLAENISEKELIEVIQNCNKDDSINCIIVQLPLPSVINKDLIINSIDPKKDVDALTDMNVQHWSNGDSNALWPATTRGIYELLNHYGISLKDKKVTIIGRSALVGKPIAALCRSKGAVVTICHRGTTDLISATKQADIIIGATGQPNLIGAEHVSAGQVIIDVGISILPDGKMVGDVDFEAVKNVVGAITPVPGGVGPMTVFALFENLVDLSCY